MIKVESDMLILDASLTKQDAQAINTFLEIIRSQERERIIKLLEQRYAENVDQCEMGTHLFLDNAIELIKGELE